MYLYIILSLFKIKHLLDFIMVSTAIFITVYEFGMKPTHILYSFPISVRILILGVELRNACYVWRLTCVCLPGHVTNFQ